ncbi:unnamed protein product [Gordionus sp. m RMFG-2023]
MESDTNYCSARSIYKRISKQAKLNKKTKKYNLIEKFNTDKQIVDTVFEDFNYENDNIKSKALNLNYTLDEEYKPYLSYKSLLLYKDSRNLALKAFEWLIFPIKFDVFINEFWEKKPLLVKRNKFDYYNELFSLCEFDIILRKEFLSFTENIDLTTYNDGIKEIHNPIGRAYSPIVWDYYNEGCSVRLLNPQKFSDNIWRLNSVLQEFFSSMVGCNVYLTPPNSQGFAPHYDDIDAFVMQIEGKKLWKVYHPYPHHKPQDKIERVKHLLPLYPSNNFSEKSDFDVHFWANPLIKTVLEPGDLLYMPRGFIHQASTLIEQDIGHINDIESREIFSCGKSKKSREINGNPNKKFKKEAKNDSQHSLHLTLSTCQNNTWGQLIKNAFDLSLKSLMQNNVKFRRSLPPRYLQYTGLPYRNVDLNFDSNKSNDPKCNVGLRTKFVSNFHSLCQDVLQNISPDLAVDIFSISSNAGCYLRDSLPPCLNIYEKMGSIFDDLDNSESCERSNLKLF